jgi:hypothetical protein
MGGVCIDCVNVARRKRGAGSAEVRRRNHQSGLLRSYGLTPDEFGVMVCSQAGRCAICGAPARNKHGGELHVDHDHATGAVRELLCMNCNSALGCMHESIGRAEAIIAYLCRHHDAPLAKLTGIYPLSPRLTEEM